MPTNITSKSRPGPWLGLALLCAASTASAGTFDPESGKLSVTDPSLSYAFDGPSPPAGLALHVFDTLGQPLEPAEIYAEALPEAEALQGQGALPLGGTRAATYLQLLGLSERLAGRRVELRIWQRSLGTRLKMQVTWHAGPVETAIETFSFGALQQLAGLRMLRSGRETSDGWVEYTSGPVDFMLGGHLAPNLLMYDDVAARQEQNSPDLDARVALDAFEILDLGPAAVPDAQCTRADEDDACGQMGVCLHGQCVDHAAVNGALFTTDLQREEYVARRVFELETFSGHQGLRAKLPGYKQELQAITANPDKRFWERLRAGWYDLADGHGAPPLAGYVTPPELGLCLVQGDADLLPGAPEVPLVFDRNIFHPLVSGLRVGDALVSIDGLSPEDWKSQVRQRLRYNGDPANAAYVESMQITRAASLTGARLEFARCEGPGVCTEQEVQTVVIEVSEALRGVWQGEPVAWRGTRVACDGRFSRLSSVNGSYQNTFTTSVVDREATVLMINATPGPFMPGFQQWMDKIARIFASPTATMILDQRVGGGGSFNSINLMMGYLTPSPGQPPHFLMPWLGELEQDPNVFDPLLACARSYGSGEAFLWCGGTRFEGPGSGHPAAGSWASTKVAVLNGRDVSGNDFLSYQLSRRTARTRIFGPGPTYGAFGMIMGLPDHEVGIQGGTLQATDASTLDAPDSPLDARMSGPGIPPDVVVLQKQSDAVAGIDTLMEAAHAWLQQ